MFSQAMGVEGVVSCGPLTPGQGPRAQPPCSSVRPAPCGFQGEIITLLSGCSPAQEAYLLWDWSQGDLFSSFVKVLFMHTITAAFLCRREINLL